MESSSFLSRLLRAFYAVGSAVLDALPPYRWVNGSLEAKEIDADGRHIILVDGRELLVDRLTFGTLELGERLRVRATRDWKAISIDRLSAREDDGLG